MSIEKRDLYIQTIEEGKVFLSTDVNAHGDKLSVYKQSLLNYKWSDELKNYAILLRDIYFRSYKSGFVAPSEQLKSSTMDLHRAATRSLIESLETILATETINARLTALWVHEHSPAATVMNHLDELILQINKLFESNNDLRAIERDLLFFKTKINHSLTAYIDNIDNLEKTIETVIGKLEAFPQPVEANVLSGFSKALDSAYMSIEQIRAKTSLEFLQFENKANLNTPVAISNGDLVMKQIDFGSQTNAWMESEILPPLMDIDRKVEQLDYSALLKIVNLRNQFALLQANLGLLEDIEISDYKTSLADVLKTAKSVKLEVEEANLQILSIINIQLGIDKVFDNRQFFLTSPTRAMLSDYGRMRNRWLDRLPWDKAKSWYDRMFDKYIASGEEVSYNVKTKQLHLIEYIKNKTLKELDKYYHSLFLNKGFLGLTFYQDRERFHKLLRRAVRQWEADYPGSLLVYGSKLSGKSTALEVIPHLLEGKEIISLKPHTQIQFNGQKVSIEGDIETAFKSFEKHTVGHKVIIIIDDIEQWAVEKIDFLDIVRKLIAIQKKYPKRYFFVLSTNLIMKSHLDTYLGFSDKFTASFDTSQMDVNDIIDIISVRHDASQKVHEINQDDLLRQHALAVAKKSNFNIGLSLLEWTRRQETEKIESHKPKEFDLLINKHRFVFEYMLKWGSIAQSELGIYKTRLFAKDLNDSIQELTNLRILHREVDGRLIIPPFIIGDVEHALARKFTLNPN